MAVSVMKTADDTGRSTAVVWSREGWEVGASGGQQGIVAFTSLRPITTCRLRMDSNRQFADVLMFTPECAP